MSKPTNLNHSETIQETCLLIAAGEIENAQAIIEKEYPFVPITKNSRSYTPRQMTGIFLRDGFIDRYRGTKLVYPPALRLISTYLPDSFPYHKNGRLDIGHIAYWEMFPTIDHIVPVSRNGEDTESNWVCCSMLTNSIKANWLLEELHWNLLPPGDTDSWDGMFGWFIRQVEGHQDLLSDKYIKTWFYAAKAVARNR